MLEKTVETYLVDRVRAAGGDAYKFSSPARASVPDRIVIFPPARVYFVELKRPGGKPTRGQVREHERLRALGCDVRVIDSREAVDAFVQKVREQLIGDDRALLVEASKFGQFDDDFDQPQAKPIRAALRRLCAALDSAMIRPEPRTAGESVFRFGDDGVCRVQHEAAPADEAGPRGYNEGFNNGWERGHVFGKEQSAGISEVLLSTIVRAARKGKSYVEGYGRAQQFLKDAGLLVDPRAVAQPEPPVADERAAYRDALALVGRGEGESSAELATIWSAAVAFARASSPNAAAEPLVLVGAEFSTDAVREAVEQGLWAADVKLTDDAWRNIEALLIEQARADKVKALRAGGAA